MKTILGGSKRACNHCVFIVNKCRNSFLCSYRNKVFWNVVAVLLEETDFRAHPAHKLSGVSVKYYKLSCLDIGNTQHGYSAQNKLVSDYRNSPCGQIVLPACACFVQSNQVHNVPMVHK